ncbi:MAG: aldehyde dehydrogenase family protein, partial [Candidatus Hydrogenedentes bacterium]|nr:aldehyde dehydrogenase family protein [Candidatus Hydrogenedentota bacterium]
MATNIYKNFIDGAWVSSNSGETFEQRNPAKLNRITGRFQRSTIADTENAIACAQAAYPGWKATPPVERAAILRRALEAMVRRKDEIAAVITEENGKTLPEAAGEVQAAILEMDFQIGEGLRLYGQTVPSLQPGMHAYSVREPLGVVSV